MAVIEDQHRMREGLRWLIEGSAGFQCAADWGSMEEALAAPHLPLLNVILLDLGLPGMSGIQGIVLLRELYPNASIVVLTVYADNESVFDALCAGAAGYLLKNTPKLLVEGYSYKSAAVELEVSIHTIGFHVQNIYGKLRVHSKSEAVARALREKLIG